MWILGWGGRALRRLVAVANNDATTAYVGASLGAYVGRGVLDINAEGELKMMLTV